MNQRPVNVYLRVNKPRKIIRKSHSHQLNARSYPVPQRLQPIPQLQVVYFTNKNDFKDLVQRLTSYESCEYLPQNLPEHQEIIPEPFYPDSMSPPSPMAVQEDPDVLLYMRYLESLLEDPSESNGDHSQQPFDEYYSHMVAQAHSQPQAPNQSNGDHSQQPFDEYHSPMLAQARFQPQAPNQSNGDHFQQPFDKYDSPMIAQAHFQPQAPNQSMPQSNGVEPVIMPTTFPSSPFNGSLQEMQDPYSLQSTRGEYPNQLTPNFTFSSMNQLGVLGPDLDCVDTSLSHMLPQAHAQPQAPQQSMPHSNGFAPVIMQPTFPSPWLNGSLQQMQDIYTSQSTRVEYPQPPIPNFTFSSVTQSGVLGPDLDYVDSEFFDVPFEIEW